MSMRAQAETKAALTTSSSFTPAGNGLLQRKCACGTPTMASGECADCARKENVLQRRLTIGASNDPLEREADRVAEQVMRMPEAEVNKQQRNPKIPLVQRRATNAGTGVIEAPPIVDEVLNLPGRPLDAATRAFFEPRFGHDFSQVHVHAGKDLPKRSQTAKNAARGTVTA